MAMTEAAKREVSMEDDATDEIAVDDPLFELSQIMGLDGDVATEPNANIDPQIDLEDALLAEMAVEPEIEAPLMATDDPAPTAESLEDELTTMLGGAVSVAAEVPAPDVETETVQEASSNSSLVAEPETFDSADDELEATQLDEAVADTDIELDELTAEFEAVTSPDYGSAEGDSSFVATETHEEIESLAEEITSAPEFETPFDGKFETNGDAVEPESVTTELSEEIADDTTLSLEEAEIELEKDFAAFFDEELPDTDLAPAFETEATLQAETDVAAGDEFLDPMDELADVVSDNVELDENDAGVSAETGAEELQETTYAESADYSAFEATGQVEPDVEPEMASVAEIEAVSADIEQLNAGIEKIFGEQVASAADFEPLAKAEIAGPELPTAPVLETTDMSAYEAANAVEVDVPELPDLENEFVAAFEEDTFSSDATTNEDDDAEPSNGVTAAMGATIAAAGATVLSRRAGETAMAADEEAFDETRFEAELARDMEFVSHDLGNSDDANMSIEQEFEDQTFAAQAAANKPAKRGLVIAAALGCVAIAGAVGIFAYSNSEVGGSDGPILVETSTDPVKIEPEVPGGKLVPNQDRAVFAENAVAPEQEALVPGAEEPVDIASVPQAALPSNLNGGDVAQKGDDRLIPEANDSVAAADEIGALLAPRKVRTLVVKPDGTLVERTVVPTPAPVVATPALAPTPAATPEIVAAIPAPAVPSSTIETPAPTTPAVVETTPEATASADAIVRPEAPDVPSNPVTNEVVAATPLASAPANGATTTEVPSVPEVQPTAPTVSVARGISNPPTIADRPNDQPLNIVNPVAEAANTQVASAPAPTATNSPAASPFSVQLASLPSQAAAQDSANNLARQFSNVIGGRGLAIREAQIEGRGTFYRVRVGASSRAEANQLCGQIKAAGGDCFVTR